MNSLLETILTGALALGACVYAAASVFLWIGGIKRPDRLHSDAKPVSDNTTFVSLIIPARNEAQNIQALVDALAGQDYPADRWEVWIIDDRSEDGTGDLVEKLLPNLPCRGHLVRQTYVPPNWSPKKHAITSTIRQTEDHDEYVVRHEENTVRCNCEHVIMTTDADCRPEPRWISAMIDTLGDADLVAGYSPYGARASCGPRTQYGARASCGPRTQYGARGPYEPRARRGVWTNLFTRMLALEAFSQGFLALSGIRLRWPITCTGRSFAYRREVFDEAGGFGSDRTMLSGDDHLFLQRAVGKGYRAVYCTAPDSRVWTDPPTSFRGFWNQRIRMFSGVGKITPSVAIVGTTTYLWMLGLFVGLVTLWPPALAGFVAKFLLDAVSLLIAARHLREWRLLLVYPVAAICYLPYFLTFAFLGTFGSYDWKGMRGR
jgi:cellulose synthase/poly-beta-1,6-N-acetylglucosamine synthase-like glycosyltransferase